MIHVLHGREGDWEYNLWTTWACGCITRGLVADLSCHTKDLEFEVLKIREMQMQWTELICLFGTHEWVSRALVHLLWQERRTSSIPCCWSSVVVRCSCTILSQSAPVPNSDMRIQTLNPRSTRANLWHLVCSCRCEPSCCRIWMVSDNYVSQTKSFVIDVQNCLCITTFTRTNIFQSCLR